MTNHPRPFRAAVAAALQGTRARVVCSFCPAVISEGTEPASHGACPQCAREQFARNHRCPETQTILIRSYPARGEFVELKVCEQCRPLYGEDDLSEVLK